VKVGIILQIYTSGIDAPIPDSDTHGSRAVY